MCQFSSVQLLRRAQLCNPMDYSTPGLPVHHQLLEFTQTLVHRVGDAIQPPHLLSSPSPSAPNPSQHQSLSNESTLRMRWPKYWSFIFSIIPSKEIPGLISLQSKGLSRVFSNTTVQKHQFFQLHTRLHSVNSSPSIFLDYSSNHITSQLKDFLTSQSLE